MGDSDLSSTFGYLARETGKRKLAFLFAREGKIEPRIGPMMKEAFGGPFIANQSLTQDDAETMLRAGEAEAISWGQLYIANPDLVERFSQGAELNKPIPETFYGDSEVGYLDYPLLKE